MLDSLEKMFAKGVDNFLLHFGLGKVTWTSANSPAQPNTSSAASNSTPSIQLRGNYWARLIKAKAIHQPHAKPGNKALKPPAPMATNRKRNDGILNKLDRQH